MHQDEFIARRHADWSRLEKLLDNANRSPENMPERDLRDLGQLYRQVTSDLALAQRDFPGEKVAVYLNQLIARAHATIYRGEPLRWRQMRRFYAQEFPALYRTLLPYTLVSFALFLIPALAAFFVVWQRPDAIYTILGPDVREMVSTVESGKLWTEIAPTVRPAMSTTVLTNNIQVMLLAFAGGITLGLLTVYVMIGNGLNLGAVFGLVLYYGLGGGLAQFISAHGFIELSVVFVAGGCGLYLGDGLIRPGLLSRRQALVDRGHLAIRLILGCVPLLILAGLIEGFISPSSLPGWSKFAIGLTTGLALHTYWLFAGRRQ